MTKIISTCSTTLEKEGFSVDGYTRPYEALWIFRPRAYDLLVVDYRMPSLNGIELCKKLRAMDNSLRAVLITAASVPVETSDCQPTKVIKKPILPTKLVEEIKRILI